MRPLRKIESVFDLLIQPSRCTAGLPFDLEKEYLVSELKLDGSRYVFYCGYDPYGRRSGNTLLSRRISTVDFVRSTDDGKIFTHVDRTENVPQITAKDYDLDGTILDGECYLTDFPTTSSIMGSGASVAVQKQKEIGLITYYVWDIMAYKGKDIRGLPLEKRRKVLIEVVKQMDNPNIKVIPQWKGEIGDRFQDVVSRGGEGLIVKDLRMGYGMGWAKMKRSHDVSTVLIGGKPGNGKYAGQIGAIELGIWSGGKLVPVGFASGFDDKLRAEITKNLTEWVKQKRVVDVFAHEVSKPSVESPCGRLRFPTFHRFRDDVESETCTFEKLRDDLKKKAKTGRWK